MEPPSQPTRASSAEPSKSWSFSFTPSAEAVQLADAARRLSMDEAYQLHQIDDAFEQLKGRFVQSWNHLKKKCCDPKTKKIEFYALLYGVLNKESELWQDVRCIEALLLLISENESEDEYKKMCENLFFYAAGELGWLSLVEFFVHNGFDVNYRFRYIPGQDKPTALHTAAYNSRFFIVRFLLENKADVNVVHRRDLSFANQV